MMPEFENMIYIDADRLAILENRAAELERRCWSCARRATPTECGRAPRRAEGGERRAGALNGGGSGGGALRPTDGRRHD